MGVMDFGPEQQRKLLELSFEPHEDDYLFYQNRWARGVRVTATERETYLSVTEFGSRRAFYYAIKGRPAEAPPRRFGPLYWRMLSRLPVIMGVTALLFGLALSSRWFVGGSAIIGAALLAPGIGLIVFGAHIIYAKLAGRVRY